MAADGLKRGDDGLQVYVICGIPSNVILAKAFAERFDDFSIGSNDLTQLTLGVDRDSTDLANLFDEQDEASEMDDSNGHRRSPQGRRKGRAMRTSAQSAISTTCAISWRIMCCFECRM